MTHRQGTRRIMTKFGLDEVSFVDRPAQADALADIAKASVEELLEDGHAGQDVSKRGDMVHLLTSSENGHQHGISVHGSGDGLHLMVHYAGSEEGDMHDHQVVRTADGNYEVSENRGHSHSIDAAQMAAAFLAVINKAEGNPEWDSIPLEMGGMALADLPEVKKASTTKLDEGDDNMSAEDLKKAEDERDAALAKAATLAKVAALNPVHKAHYDAMDESLDDEARKSFLEMGDAAKDAEVSKASAAATDTNPVVYKALNGDEFRKNDDPRLVAAVKASDEDRKALALEKAKTQDVDLTKRAEELDNLPGDLKVRKAILKAVDSIEDEDVRKSAHDALAAKNAAMHGALTTVGTSAAPSLEKSSSAKDAEAELDRLAKELASKDSIDYFDAYQKVADGNEELVTKAVAG